jgi:hypothetical protein
MLSALRGELREVLRRGKIIFVNTKVKKNKEG